MLRILSAVLVIASCAVPAGAQTGLTYRYKSENGTGQVWVLGENARRQLDARGNGPLGGHVEIWTNGGKEQLMLAPAQRTYHDVIAHRARNGVSGATMPMLTVGRPFRVDGADAVKIDVTPSRRPQQIGGYTCHPMRVDFSYTLKLSIEGTSGTFPARVEGVEDLCIMDAENAPQLPFDHAIALRSTHPDVDRVLVPRLLELKGIPVFRLLKVTRKIEGGEQTSATSGLLLTDIREVAVPADHFRVPAGYRRVEPVITRPSRK